MERSIAMRWCSIGECSEKGESGGNRRLTLGCGNREILVVPQRRIGWPTWDENLGFREKGWLRCSLSRSVWHKKESKDVDW